MQLLPLRRTLIQLHVIRCRCVLLVPAESAGVLLDAGSDYHLAKALLQPAIPANHPTAALPSMGDVPLAVHVLLSQVRPQVGTTQWLKDGTTTLCRCSA